MSTVAPSAGAPPSRSDPPILVGVRDESAPRSGVDELQVLALVLAHGRRLHQDSIDAAGVHAVGCRPGCGCGGFGRFDRRGRLVRVRPQKFDTLDPAGAGRVGPRREVDAPQVCRERLPLDSGRGQPRLQAVRIEGQMQAHLRDRFGPASELQHRPVVAHARHERRHGRDSFARAYSVSTSCSGPPGQSARFSGAE